MKALIKFYFTAALFLLTLTASAGVTSDYVVTVKGDNSFHLYFNQTSDNDFQVSIKDAAGVVLWDLEIENEHTFSQSFDLGELPEGSYSLVIENELGIEVQSIVLENGQLIVDPTMKTTVFKPTFKQHEDFVDMTLLKLEEADVQMKIVDKTGRELFVEKISNKGSIQKRFNVSGLEKGEYVFKLSGNGQSFYEQIQIK